MEPFPSALRRVLSRAAHLGAAGSIAALGMAAGCHESRPADPPSVAIGVLPPPLVSTATAPLPQKDERVVPVQVSGTDTHACARMSDGTVFCWGQSYGGQLGDGSRDKGNFSENPPRRVPGIDGVVEVAVGAYQSCARRQDHTLHCWGTVLSGDSYTAEGRIWYDSPTRIGGLPEIESVSIGIGHVCVLALGGTVWCWGENYAGALGDGQVGNRRLEPKMVAGLTEVTQMAVGDRFSCARLADKTVRCWGENHFGTLGDGTRHDQSRPIQVPGINDARRVVAIGEGWACVVHEDGGVSCWGTQAYGTDPAHKDPARPARVLGLDRVVQLSGSSRTACARRFDNTVLCWGKVRPDFEPGSGLIVETPTLLPDLLARDATARGGLHALTVSMDGALERWGRGATLASRERIDLAP